MLLRLACCNWNCKNNEYDPPGFSEDIQVVDLGLRLELKSDQKVGDNCSRNMLFL